MKRYLVVWSWDEAIVAQYDSLIGAMFHGYTQLDNEINIPWGVFDLFKGRFLTHFDLLMNNIY